jgi:hypothetical protein
MSERYHVEARAISTDDTVPGRFAESGLWELVGGLGGPSAGEDVWGALREVFSSMSESQLGERLLDMILLKPPIPAGCDALLQAMKDPHRAPWLTHEVLEDRFWLWYAHSIVHRVFPDRFPAPTVCRVDLAVTTLHPDARPPGARTTARDRTRFVAQLLAGRPGENPLSGAFEHGHHEEWAFDVVWGCEVVGRSKPEGAVLVARGASEQDAASGRLFELSVRAWMSPQWVGGLREGEAWQARIGG